MERHCFQQLPDGYEKTLTLDLQKDTKLALVVNGLAVGIAAVMFAAGFLLMPTFTISASLPALAAFLVCTVLYMVLHELVHGACMKLFGAKKVRFGFTGMYAFAGSSEYFKKVAYIVVALAPLVVWGAVFLALNLALGQSISGSSTCCSWSTFRARQGTCMFHSAFCACRKIFWCRTPAFP